MMGGPVSVPEVIFLVGNNFPASGSCSGGGFSIIGIAEVGVAGGTS